MGFYNINLELVLDSRKSRKRAAMKKSRKNQSTNQQQPKDERQTDNSDFIGPYVNGGSIYKGN